MRIGIITNSDLLIPITSTLAAQKQQVYVFLSPSPDHFVNQKVNAFLKFTHIPFCVEKNNKLDIYEWLKKGLFDICFIIGYNRLLNINHIPESTQLFNIHFGPLPAYKGPSPVFWQLKDSNKKIGLCIHRVNEKFDDGAVVWIKEIENRPHYDNQIVTLICSQLCVEGVFFILQHLSNGLPLIDIVREQVESSYFKRPSLKDVVIDWQLMDATTVCRLVMACNPWNKGAMTFYNKQELKLLDARISDQKTNEPGGTIIKSEENLLTACCDGSVVASSMVFYNDTFIPAYRLKLFGFQNLHRFENINI